VLVFRPARVSVTGALSATAETGFSSEIGFKALSDIFHSPTHNPCERVGLEF
jgi:hypothetical protein